MRASLLWAFVETGTGTAGWRSLRFPALHRCYFFHSVSHSGCLQEATGGAPRMGGWTYGVPEVARGGWQKAGPQRAYPEAPMLTFPGSQCRVSCPHPRGIAACVGVTSCERRPVVRASHSVTSPFGHRAQC